MAELALIALNAPNIIIDNLKSISGIARDLGELSERKEEVFQQLRLKCKQIDALRAQLINLTNWTGSLPDFSPSSSSHHRKHVILRVNECLGHVNDLKDYIHYLQKNADRKCHKLFPSLSERQLLEVDRRVSSTRSAIDALFAEIQSLRIEMPNNSTNSKGDKFVCNTCMVDNNPPGMFFDFDSRDATSDEPLTPAGQLMDAILNNYTKNTRTIIVKGDGGAGKSCALRAIGQHDKVTSKFKGGVVYFTLGENAGVSELRECIAKVVERAGGKTKAQEVRKAPDLTKCVHAAGSWFAHHSCLFLIDDVWPGSGISQNTIVSLSNLVKNSGSLIACTTRDRGFRGDVDVTFEARDFDSPECKNMLLKNAGLDFPNTPERITSFKRILESCSGLPYAIALAGGAVYNIAARLPLTEKEKAWNLYEGFWNSYEGEEMKRRLTVSLDIIDRDTQTSNVRARFEALCVLRQTQYVPISVLARLWNLPDHLTRREVKKFARYSIIRSSVSRGEHWEEVFGLHDITLKIAGEFADESRNRIQYSRQLIASYLSPHARSSMRDDVPSQPVEIAMAECSHEPRVCTTCLKCQTAQFSQRFRHSWLTVVHDRYASKNICWLLRCGGLSEDMFWLVCQPSWTVKQLTTYGTYQVEDELSDCRKFLQSCEWRAARKIDAETWIDLLKHAIRLCKSSIITTPQMVWFELYGRLTFSPHYNELAMRYVADLEQQAPKPWLKPGPGCLSSAGEALSAEIKYRGELICTAQIDNVIHVCTRGEEGNFFLIETDMSSNTELVGEIKLHGIQIAQEITSGAFSNDASAVLLGAKNGELFVLQASRGAESPNSQQGQGKGAVKSQVYDESRSDDDELKRFSRLFRIICFNSNDSGDMTNVNGVDDRIVSCSTRVGSADCRLVGSAARRKIWSLHKMTGHKDSVRSVVMSDDGTRIVSGSSDNTVRVWDLQENNWNSTVLSGHGNAVLSVVMSGDGTRIVSGSSDNTVCVSDLVENKWESIFLPGHSDWVRSVVMSGDSTRIVSGSDDNTVRVWDLTGNKWDSFVLSGHGDGVLSVEMNDDGTRIVSGSSDNTVCVWDLAGYIRNSTALSGHSNEVENVVMSDDGARNVSESWDSLVRLWFLAQNKWNSTVLAGHSNGVWSVVMSDDGTQIVSGSHDKTVRVWDLAENKWNRTIDGHRNRVLSVVMNDDGTRIVSGSKDNTVCVWDLEENKWNSTVLSGHSGWVWSVLMNDDGTRIVSESSDNTVRVWNLVWNKWKSTVHSRLSNWVWRVMMSDDGTRIVPRSWDNTVRVWQCTDDSLGEKRSFFDGSGSSHFAFLHDKLVRSAGKDGKKLPGKLTNRIVTEVIGNDNCVLSASSQFASELKSIVSSVGAKCIFATRNGFGMIVDRRPYLVFVTRLTNECRSIMYMSYKS